MRERDARPAFAVERLRRRSDFRAASRGARASGAAFVLQARPRGDDGAVRIGFTVSKQVGNAVERNRVRRRLREMVRLSAAKSDATLRPGHDYVLVGRRAALAAPFGTMLQDLDVALRRVHGPRSAGTGGPGSGPLHEPRSPSRPPQRRGREEPSQPPTEAPPQER